MKQRSLMQPNDDSATGGRAVIWAATSPPANAPPPPTLPLTSAGARASAADNSRSNPWKP
jgi:hypothetical protein